MSIHQGLDPAQSFFYDINIRMGMNEKYGIFQTEIEYLGIGPKITQKGDVVCVMFGCKNLVVLRLVGCYYLHLGPCFILGFMEGEATRDEQNHFRDIQNFELH